MTSSQESIPPQDVIFHPHSFADYDGRLFSWEGNLYRGISAERAAFFLQLFRNGSVQDLIGRGLVATKLTDFSLDGYALVVQHKEVPFPSYPNEWCMAMLKDAAALILDLAIDLTHKKLSLKDGHPWNVLFDFHEPKLVDLTSIVPLGSDREWLAYDEFCRFCYYPLILMAHGQERIARCLLSEYEGVKRTDLLALARSFTVSTFAVSKLFDRIVKPIRTWKQGDGPKSQLSTLRQLKRDLEMIVEPSHSAPPALAREVRTQVIAGGTETAEWQVLYKVLSDKRPGSVLDIANGEFHHPEQITRLGCEVVYFAANSESATRVYRDARKQSLRILPLLIDILKPTPSIGYSSHYSIAATERFKCDMVVGLTLVDYLVLGKYFNFDLIAEILSSFSKRWAIAGFSSREYLEADRRLNPPSWYTLDNFMNALRVRFRSVEAIWSDSGGRAFLFCAM
jgi:hypothetical protein